MVLSPVGEIVKQEWEKSFEIREELTCDVYVIMPNHIHGIVRINKAEAHNNAGQHNGVAYRAPKSVSSFVAGFKSATTKQIRALQDKADFAVWQTRFHDHIIRNDDEYRRIANYIVNNPRKWVDDKFHVVVASSSS
jgi:REP element-mobilizing transposase RayT